MSAPIVSLTKNTAVKGFVKATTERLRDVNCFTGIPYAVPPIRQLRFKPPQLVQLWDGVRDCTQYGAICPQDLTVLKRTYRPYVVPTKMSEDCLYLNVFSPILGSKAKLPVMVWIHGGAFSMGFSDFYDGTAICNFNDVVVVSINYRLGPFGFLSTGDNVISGNMGLLDQVEALKWVQKYISGFGGDHCNVTIFGESAGAISVSYHMLSPLTEGLFHKVICQSGVSIYPSSTWPWANARNYLLGKLNKTGFKSTDSNVVEKYLQSMSVENILKLGEGFTTAVIDGIFLPDQPQNLYDRGLFHKNIDMILGFNTHEGGMFIFEMCKNERIDTTEKARNKLRIIIDQLFFRKCPNSTRIKELVFEEYLKEASDHDSYLKGLIEIYGDLLFVAPTHKIALEHANQSNGKVFVYKFTHKLQFTGYPASQYDWLGADHGAEILFVFGEPFLGRFPDIWTLEDQEISKDIMAVWCEFAKSGNPNGKLLADWPQHTAHKGELLMLKPDFEVITEKHEPLRMQLWNDMVSYLAKQQPSKY